MKIDSPELRGMKRDLIEWVDRTNELVNFGKYQFPSVTAVPTWAGRKGEQVLVFQGVNPTLYVCNIDESVSWVPIGGQGGGVVQITENDFDGDTIIIDASLGKIFDITMTRNITIGVPLNPADGLKIIFRILSSGGSFLATFIEDVTDGFRFNNTRITGTSATDAEFSDDIGCIYNLATRRWEVVAIEKGY